MHRKTSILVVMGSLFGKPLPASFDVFKILKKLYKSVKIFVVPIAISKHPHLLLYTLIKREVLLVMKIIKEKRKGLRLLVFHQVSFPFAITLARLLRIKAVVYIGGSIFEDYYFSEYGMQKIVSLFSILTWKWVLRLANVIIGPTRKILHFSRLYNFKNKFYVAPTRTIDTQIFRVIKPLDKREDIIGFIGRFSREKGVLNFVNAIPKILNNMKKISFMIVGDGPLYDEINKLIILNNINQKVTVMRWVNVAEIPKILNELKLLVLPSYSEGIPSIILEAMACGTPVLATCVGGVSEIIKDYETGFLLESNDATHIAERVISILNDSELLIRVSVKARRFFEKTFNYQGILSTWKEIINNILY